jgi:hypothetical protein
MHSMPSRRPCTRHGPDGFEPEGADREVRDVVAPRAKARALPVDESGGSGWVEESVADVRVAVDQAVLLRVVDGPQRLERHGKSGCVGQVIEQRGEFGDCALALDVLVGTCSRRCADPPG